jgi:SAM-dependent methyltransferase
VCRGRRGAGRIPHVTVRSLSFGAAASAYEQFRPGYPEELVDEVLAYAGRPVRTALEIGAGTGKATRVFAGRGIEVTATDPDPEMLAELRKHGPAVTTVRAAFEDLPLTATYDLVFAAASFHWTDPTHRSTRVASLLNAEGVFASFGGQLYLADPGVEDKVRAARAPFLAADDVPSPDGTPSSSPMQWPGTELARSGHFVDVRQSGIERRVQLSAEDYVGHLSTVSAYLLLPDAVRRHVLDLVLDVLPPQVTVVADLTVHLARKA